MITARFLGTVDALHGVRVSGHAGFADFGQDIACASVTSAVQMTANALTEILKIPADVKVLEDTISIALPQGTGCQAAAFLQALHLHMELLAEEFPGNIKVIVSEV